MTTTIREIELVEELFEEFDITCQPFSRECDAKAEWLMLKSCGCEIPLCAPHKATVKTFYDLCDFKVRCAVCHESITVKFVPI